MKLPFIPVLLIAFFLDAESIEINLPAIPLVQLIATPDQFDNKYLSVVGVFKFDLDSSTLYLSREHYVVDVFSSSISIDFLEKGEVEDIENLNILDGCYVRVEGVFSSVEKGYMGFNQGTMKRVQRIEKYACPQ